MNVNIAKNRMSDVLMIDSIDSSPGDFLATHVPFKDIFVKQGIDGSGGSYHISEDDVFNKIYEDPAVCDTHQLIIVEGSSGSGKSHFIRWLNAKIKPLSEEKKDVVLLIRRSDNTLKGTIKQLLNINEIKNIKNKDAYERLVKANQTISEKKFKDSIYSKFYVEIKNDEEDSVITTVRKKQLLALLNNSLFEERMLSAGGPIDRIYKKISSDAGSNEDVVALFTSDDFALDYDFCEKLQEDQADKKAIKMANSLLPDETGENEAEKIAEYMNLWVDNVIQSCAGIEPGDFQQIFKEIRQELYTNGKKLVLLIEDITSFTGINQDLLNALITSHTGLNEEDHMCRLMSVVGTTTEYYRQFRDNYKDRITTQITIEDGTIGSNLDDVVLFVAKYLNVMSLPSEKVNKWYEGGSIETEYPVHTVDVAGNWLSFPYSGKELNIYPFTKKAIINLYKEMDEHKTPRYIIRDIIEPAANDVLFNKGGFPSFFKAKSLKAEVRTRIFSIVNNLPISEDNKANYRERICSIVGYWGDGTLNGSTDDIGSIPRFVFDEFGLSEFSNTIAENPSPHKENPVKPDPDPSLSTKPNPFADKLIEYNAFIEMLDKWYLDKNQFIVERLTIRDEICKFVFSTLNWQRNDVPIKVKTLFEDSSNTLVGIIRSRAIDKCAVVLQDDLETYDLLRVFGRWNYLGKNSWNYSEASDEISLADDILCVTSWLEKNRHLFVEAVNEGKTNVVPDYIVSAMQAFVFSSVLNNDFGFEKLDEIDASFFLRKPLQRQEGLKHSKSWNSLLDLTFQNGSFETSIKLIQDFFNIQQGVSVSSRKYTINNSLLSSALKKLKESEFKPSRENNSKIKAKNEQIERTIKIYDRLEKVVEEEKTFAFSYIKKILDYFEYDLDDEIESEDILSLLDDITVFYKECDKCGVSVDYRKEDVENTKKIVKSIVDAIERIKKAFDNKTAFQSLILLGSNPLNPVIQFCDLLDNVNADVKKISTLKENQKKEQIEKGFATSEDSSKFKEFGSEFEALIKEAGIDVTK